MLQFYTREPLLQLFYYYAPHQINGFGQYNMDCILFTSCRWLVLVPAMTIVEGTFQDLFIHLKRPSPLVHFQFYNVIIYFKTRMALFLFIPSFYRSSRCSARLLLVFNAIAQHDALCIVPYYHGTNKFMLGLKCIVVYLLSRRFSPECVLVCKNPKPAGLGCLNSGMHQGDTFPS